MKASVLFILVLFTATAYSQNTINNYKYVIVPERFAFSKSDNQYGLNTVAKALLEEKGFTVFIGNSQLPPEVAGNKCNALNTEVVERKGFLVTNLTLMLKDCQGNIIFKSKEGKSREKEWQMAYDQALRDAFTSLKDVAYKYDGTTITQPQQSAVTVTPATSSPAPAPVAPASAAITETTGTLYAQATPNGFQLIDTTPKKVLTLLKTSMPDYFIAENGAINGIVFKKSEDWMYEYYKDNKLVSVKLQIKF